MKEENNNSESIKKRFYKLNKEELKLIELLDNIKSESSTYLYLPPPMSDPAGSA